MNTRSRTGLIIGIVAIVIVALIFGFKHKTGPTEKPIAQTTFTCKDNKTIKAVFFAGKSETNVDSNVPPKLDGRVELSLSDGRNLTLNQAVSADGSRYANADESFVFWNKGNGALVLENNTQSSFVDCVNQSVLSETESDNDTTSHVYSSNTFGFSVRLPSLASLSSNNPDSYIVNEKYSYQALGPGKDIPGIKFTIPKSMTTGTNLGPDSYISVERLPKIALSSGQCSATRFLSRGVVSATTTEEGITYSVASSSEAAAGNRYEEIVYAYLGTNPCMAVRYFIHYGAFENYPAGSIHKFDRNLLLYEFDQIRRSVEIRQG